MKVEFFKHNIGIEEKESVSNALDSLFLTTGNKVDQFEKKFSESVGTLHSVALNSCTAALHLSLIAAGIGPGDEVITTPMTFVATSLAIIHCGAKPVWVDVEPESGNLDATKIEHAITEKTKAIIPVHLYGQLCDMIEIRRIADKYHLKVIEDAAHALEAMRNGIHVGQLADATCFSFYCTKSITSGEGGAVATNSFDFAEKIRRLRSHGMTKDAANRYGGEYKHWDLVEFGWKYNMSDIQASLLIPQLKKINRYWDKRRHIFDRYNTAFESMDDIKVPTVYDDSRSGYHLYTIWVNPERRDAIIKEMQKRGVGVAVNYRSINLLLKFKEFFGKKRGNFPESEKIGDSTISLPTYPKLKENEIDYIITSIKDALNSTC